MVAVIGIKEGDRDHVDVDHIWILGDHTIIDVSYISILIGCLLITIYLDVDQTLVDHNFVS